MVACVNNQDFIRLVPEQWIDIPDTGIMVFLSKPSAEDGVFEVAALRDGDGSVEAYDLTRVFAHLVVRYSPKIPTVKAPRTRNAGPSV
jgi:hypothetical protein